MAASVDVDRLHHAYGDFPVVRGMSFSLAPGAIANVTISVKIPANTPPGTAIAMLANVTTTTADPNNSNNSASKLFYWQ